MLLLMSVLGAVFGYCLCGLLSSRSFEDRLHERITSAADSGKPVYIEGKQYNIEEVKQ